MSDHRAPAVRAVAAMVGFVAVCLLLAAWPGGASGQDVKVVRDVPYHHGPTAHADYHVMDLFLPAGRVAYPVVLFVHGGAWSTGDKQVVPGELYDNIGRALAGHGIGVALTNYRLTDGQPDQAVHPDHAEDVARAAAFLRAYLNAEGIAPTDVFLMGHDAGAHLSALLATNGRFLAGHGLSPNDLRGVVGLSGIYAIDPDDDFAADVFTADPATRRDASPLHHVTVGAPPFLLLYASADRPGRDIEVSGFAGALRDAAVPATVYRVEDRDHDTLVSAIGQPGDRTTALILTFITDHVYRTPTPVPSDAPTPTSTPNPTATPAPVDPPRQPSSGPGGAARPHQASRLTEGGEAGSRYVLVEPDDPMPASAPVVVFLAADGDPEAASYRAWLIHAARGGVVVVVPAYHSGPAGDGGAWTDAANAALVSALAALESDARHVSPDLSGLVYVGHGPGALVAANLAAEWLPRGLPPPRGLMLVTPVGAPGLALADLSRVPSDTRTLLVMAEDDAGRDPTLERALWRGLADIPGAWRQQVVMRTDRYGRPALVADATTAYTEPPGGVADALDWYGSWKWLDALVTCATRGEACRYAFGDTPEQRGMGAWSDGRPVRPSDVHFGPPLEPSRLLILPIATR